MTLMKVGFIGTGAMGRPMATCLLNAGLEVAVYNRTEERTAPLVAGGAQLCGNPTDVISIADVVFVMVSDGEAVREVLLAESAKRALDGTTIVQMSTIGPDESRKICSEVEAVGGSYLEAPVLGSIPQAEDGSLIIMVGGTQELFVRWYGPLTHLGTEPQLIGPVGSAAALKLCMNQLIASLTGAFALSLGAALREGVPVESFMGILRESVLYAPTFDKKLEGMLENRFTPANFTANLLLKDVRLFLDMATEHRLDPQALQATEAILRRTLDLGLGDSDYSALAKAVWDREPSADS